MAARGKVRPATNRGRAPPGQDRKGGAVATIIRGRFRRRGTVQVRLTVASRLVMGVTLALAARDRIALPDPLRSEVAVTRAPARDRGVPCHGVAVDRRSRRALSADRPVPASHVPGRDGPGARARRRAHPRPRACRGDAPHRLPAGWPLPAPHGVVRGAVGERDSRWCVCPDRGRSDKPHLLGRSTGTQRGWVLVSADRAGLAGRRRCISVPRSSESNLVSLLG